MQADPDYPIPWRMGSLVLLAAITGRRRSLHEDACRTLALARLPVRITGQEHIPRRGPALVVFNHYSRPGFGVWWPALAIAAQAPVEMHWSMSAEWTSDGSLPSAVRAWVSRWLLPRLAHVYGFTAMPPMPPRQHEVEARARAVRHLLEAARRQPPPVIGLSPEGRDTASGALDEPPSGAGRLLQRLAALEYLFHPLGAWEAEHALQLSYGAPFRLELPPGLSRLEVDAAVNAIIMRAIARQLPAHLQGIYGEDRLAVSER